MDNNESAKWPKVEPQIPGLEPSCSQDIECNTYVDKDKEINKYRQRCFKFDYFCQKLNKDILEYQKEVSQLKEENVRKEEDFGNKRKEFDSYKNITEKKIRILENSLQNSRTALDSQLIQQKQRVDELNKDLNNKNEVIKQLNESKSLVNNNNDIINKLKSEKAELNNQLLLKEAIHSNEIQILNEELEKSYKQIKECKNAYKQTLLENHKLKDEMEKMNFKQTLAQNKRHEAMEKENEILKTFVDNCHEMIEGLQESEESEKSIIVKSPDTIMTVTHQMATVDPQQMDLTINEEEKEDIK